MKKTNTSIRNYYPLLTAAVVLAFLLSAMGWWIARHTEGHFSYPLDDSFIHLSLAKHMAQDYTWGINSGEYSAASSSPLFTVLLSIFIRAGIHSMLLPFYLNAVIAFLLLYTADRLLRQYNIRPVARGWILQAIIWLTPLPVMVYCGMEHLLHAWLVLLLLQQTILLLQPAAGKQQVWLVALTAALTLLVRFESLFVLAAVIALLLFYKRWAQATTTLLLAVLPMCIAGWMSIQHGGYFLPNSVLLKGSAMSGGWEQLKHTIEEILVFKLVYGNNTLINAFTSKYTPAGAPSLSGASLLRLLFIVPVLLLFIKPVNKDIRQLQMARQFAWIYVIACVLHLALAAVGWLFRYEAYLVAIGVFTTGLLLSLQWQEIRTFFLEQWLPGKLIFAFLAVFVSMPLFMRAASAMGTLPKACRNIYEQQFQVASFLQAHYNTGTVAVNDIGAVSYFPQARILDLWGLGNNRVAAAKLHHYYTPAFLQELVIKEKTGICIVYDDWFEPALLSHWTKVATWQIKDNVICGGDTVSFYAVDQTTAAALQQQLKTFSSKLPQRVAVTYIRL